MIRHGETVNNIERKMQGWCDSPLTERGVQQMRAVGKRLADIRFEAAYSGDLPRQIRSAQLIMGENASSYVPELKTDSRFRETSYGSFEGMDIDETFKRASRILPPDAENVNDLFSKFSRSEIYDMVAKADSSSRAETGEQTSSRLIEGILDLADQTEKALYEDRDPEVLVVSSGGALGLLLDRLDPENLFSHRMGNGDYAVLEVNRGEIKVREHNVIE